MYYLIKLLVLGVACLPVVLFALNWQQFIPAPDNNTASQAALSTNVSNGMLDGSYLTEEQARSIFTNHVTKLNPALQVGRINDAGRFFEAKILSKDNVVVQQLGVEKGSCRLIELN
jgi:hypothetical protein